MNYILHVTTVHVHVLYYDTLTTLHVLYSLGTTYSTCRICTCTVHELSLSIQLEVSHVFIVGKFAQMGSVSPLWLSLARSLALSG